MNQFGFAGQFRPHSVVILPESHEGMGWAGFTDSKGAPSGVAYPSANLSLWFPIRIDRPWVARIAFFRGGNTTGSIDVGIYDSTFTRIISTGAVGNANALVQTDIADTTLQPGDYYWAIACNNAAGSLRRRSVDLSILQTEGCLELVSNYVLGAGPLSPTKILNAYVPLFGFTTATVI